MLRNEVLLVDINDNEIGVEYKEDAHKKPMLHRAFSVYLYNDKKQMLIQKRALHKYHSPGLWANACCSHPRKGENVKYSAKERMIDEIGVSTEIKELFSFIYLNKFNEELYEYEYDHVFVGEYNGDVLLNKEEASETKWIDLDELEEDLVSNPLKYSSWFIISAPRVIEYIRNL